MMRSDAWTENRWRRSRRWEEKQSGATNGYDKWLTTDWPPLLSTTSANHSVCRAPTFAWSSVIAATEFAAMMVNVHVTVPSELLGSSSGLAGPISEPSVRTMV
jgi:hypothetical protein